MQKYFLQQFQTEHNKKMKPQRPDSAKSAKTRITVDSDASSNNITQSRFSETYSNGVKLSNQKNNQFEKYVSEKNKDPRFKKFLEPTMPEIPEQLRPTAELSRLASKPFEKKIVKIQKEKSEKKVEQPPKQIEPEIKGVKKQNLQTSKSFLDKSKRKLKIPSKNEIQENQSNIQEKNPNIENQPKPKAKINLNGFVLNIPGKAPQVIKQQKVQKVQETQQAKQKRQRERIMTEISEYVQEMQDKNYDYLPKRYDEFIERNLGNQDVSLQMIKIEDFLEDPTQKDYDYLMKKINQNQQRLQSNEKPMTSRSQSSASINLEQILDGSEVKKQEQNDDRDDTSVIMSSMTASDVRDRNMFLTQILKGKRISQQSLAQIKQNNDTMVKLIKLEGANKQPQLEQDDIELTEINMSKKKSNRIMERNRLEAAGDLYRECDYLTQEERQRIDDLINGVQIQSPFEMTEMERFMSRRIDEGIKIHRQLCADIEGNSNSQVDIVIDESTLPKDPILRKKAQLKILRQKINSVNSRLTNMNEIIVNKTKIQNLINKYKQVIKPSKMSQSLIMQKRKQIESQCQQLKQAEQILNSVVNEKEQILKTMEQMIIKFATMEAETAKILKMDAEQLRKMEQDKLKSKKKRIQEIENEAKQFQSQISGIIQIGEQIKRKMQVLDQIMAINSEQIKCEGYQQGETIQDLDELITKRWQDAEEAVRMSRYHQN